MTNSGPSHSELAAEGFVTIEDAAAYLSVGRSKLYELLGSGELVSVKVGRARRIPRAALVAYGEALLADAPSKAPTRESSA